MSRVWDGSKEQPKDQRGKAFVERANVQRCNPVLGFINSKLIR